MIPGHRRIYKIILTGQSFLYTFLLFSFAFFLTSKNIHGDAQDIFSKYYRSVVLIRSDLSYAQGVGSGFFYETQGYIITNYHVIRGARHIDIEVLDEAKKIHYFKNIPIVAIDPINDLAMLKLDNDLFKGFTYVKSNTLTKYDVGSEVYAIGNPSLGNQILTRTITSGIISAKERSIENMILIQHTAPVNPGNSGGPLFDEFGNLIGINTSKGKNTEGLSFAVPIKFASPARLLKDFNVKNKKSPLSDDNGQISGHYPA
jgi:S1-C subfamily serine protease